MAILLELKPDIEARIRAEADANGLPVADFAGRLIEQHATAARHRRTEELADRLMSLARECRALPLLDPRAAEELLGYDDNGLPNR